MVAYARLRRRLAACPTVSCANIPASATPRLPCLRLVRVLPRSQTLGSRTAISVDHGTDPGLGSLVVRGEARGRRRSTPAQRGLVSGLEQRREPGGAGGVRPAGRR